MEIPLKKKYRPAAKLYGFPRQHQGNSNKKVKKIGSNGAFQPYDKRSTVLVLENGRHRRWYHGEEAREILGDV